MNNTNKDEITLIPLYSIVVGFKFQIFMMFGVVQMLFFLLPLFKYPLVLVVLSFIISRLKRPLVTDKLTGLRRIKLARRAMSS